MILYNYRVAVFAGFKLASHFNEVYESLELGEFINGDVCISLN